MGAGNQDTGGREPGLLGSPCPRGRQWGAAGARGPGVTGKGWGVILGCLQLRGGCGLATWAPPLPGAGGQRGHRGSPPPEPGREQGPGSWARSLVGGPGSWVLGSRRGGAGLGPAAWGLCPGGGMPAMRPGGWFRISRKNQPSPLPTPAPRNPAGQVGGQGPPGGRGLLPALRGLSAAAGAMHVLCK